MDTIVKIKNIGDTDLPEHAPKSKDCAGRGCPKCRVPTWNRIEFPLKKGEILTVKTNVGNHLVSTFRNRIQIVGGPYDTSAILSADTIGEFFEHDPVTGKFRAIPMKINTTPFGSSQDPDADGEDISDVKTAAGGKGRYAARGGHLAEKSE